jgi:hypothetical protein
MSKSCSASCDTEMTSTEAAVRDTGPPSPDEFDAYARVTQESSDLPCLGRGKILKLANAFGDEPE